MQQMYILQKQEIERQCILQEQERNPNAESKEDEQGWLLKQAAITPAPKAPPPLRNILSQETNAIRRYNSKYGRITLDVKQQLNDQIVLWDTLTNLI